ncbi:MAG: hypothetical protein V3U57_03465 [Robiginitomaculum sp.]
MSTVKNTLEGRKKQSPMSAVFNPQAIILMILLGVFSFGAYFVLAGFSGDLKSGNNGGNHALSRSATGFGGLMYLLGKNAADVDISRNEELSISDQDKLHILSPQALPYSSDLNEMNINMPTLIILPKWNTRKLPKHKGWVRKVNAPFNPLISKDNLATTLHPIVENIEIHREDKENMKITIAPNGALGNNDPINFYNFEHLQTIHGDGLTPLITSNGKTILARVTDGDEFIYILSDPDFLNTHAIAHTDMAEFALALMEMIELDAKTSGYLFDLTLHGFSNSQNLIKLALTPPFLGATLCLLAMGLLMGWQAFMRFGNALRPVREFALGKLSLVFNAANFIRLAGREYKMVPDYAKITKKIVSDQLHISSSLSDKEQTERLDAYSRHAGSDKNWSQLEAQSTVQSDSMGLIQMANSLFNWRTQIIKKSNLSTGKNTGKSGEKS